MVETAVRAHQLDEAADYLARFQEWVEQFPTTARLSLLARCQALAAEFDAGSHLARSNELAEALSPFEWARTELLYAEWLRRERRRVNASPPPANRARALSAASALPLGRAGARRTEG
jgi:hypothetical protein